LAHAFDLLDLIRVDLADKHLIADQRERVPTLAKALIQHLDLRNGFNGVFYF